MPFPFICPHCGHETSVPDEMGGQRGPCAGCGETVIPVLAHTRPRQPTRSSSFGFGTLFNVLICVLFVVVMVVLLRPVQKESREAARRMGCTNNLKQIGIALHNYHDTYGSFPPAVVTDEDGQPLYSWRVLILPFMEQEALYKAFQLDEPWDSPTNLPISQTTIPGFQCPDEESSPGTTDYVMIVGPDMISDGTSITKFRNILDGTSNTLMVVEATGGGIHWAEPRDLDAGQLNFGINSPSGRGIQSIHPGGTNIALCDGSVRFISETTDLQTLRNLATINDGNRVGEF